MMQSATHTAKSNRTCALSNRSSLTGPKLLVHPFVFTSIARNCRRLLNSGRCNFTDGEPFAASTGDALTTDAQLVC